MDNIVESQKFSNPVEDIDKDLVGRIIDWIERQNYYPIAKRLNYLLLRVNDNKVEITPEGNEVNQDGNWRFFIDSSGDLIIQKRVSGTWINYLLQNGDANGQMLFWDGVKWAKTETSEMMWDDINKTLGINDSSPDANAKVDVKGTVMVTRILAGGVF